MQKIIQLKADNIKRLVAVEITPGPDSNMIVVGGDNAQGKTSLLDAIAMAIGGGDQIPERPIRDGSSKGSIVIETEEYTVTRTFSAKGTSLTIKNKEGVPMGSPQTLLDKLTSRVSFDPLAFTRLEPDDQSETLRRLVGVDFTALENEAAAKYNERTGINRQVKEQQVIADRMQRHPDAPKEIALPDPILERLGKAQETNADNDAKRNKVVAANDHIGACEITVHERDKDVARIKEALAQALEYRNAAAAKLAEAVTYRDNIFKESQALVDVDLEPIQAEFKALEAENQKVRDNQAWKAEQEKLSRLTRLSASLTDRLAEIEREKEVTLAKTKFPVDGLAFTPEGVTFNGVPFSQASGAEQLRVSVAMGFALAPELKVALIRDGSLLDDKNLALVAEIAEKHGGQVWIERVGKGEECTVILEAGEVAEDRTAKPKKKPAGK